MPKTKLGKWSSGLNIIFLVVVIAAVLLTQVIKLLDFEDTWWDITVVVLVFATLIAFITGLVAWIKNKDHSKGVLISILISVVAILFALLHSLFISD
ncbi:MAG: hypothetical protein V1853_00190 [bacterium]